MLGRSRVLLAEGGLAILALEVATSPDAGTNPDGGDADYEDDEHDNPFPVVGHPVAAVSVGGAAAATRRA